MMTNIDYSIRSLLETLFSAPETLLSLSHISDPYELMEALMNVFDIKDLSQEQLLKVIQYGDGYAIEPDLTCFFRFWRPAGYKIEQGEINWRLITAPLPFSPFYDDRMLLSTSRSTLATLLKPRIRFDYLQAYQSKAEQPVLPKGFIFHLSRCGSTLLSNAMEATGHFSVISEASYLTNLLLDQHRSEQDKIDILRVLLPCHPNALVKFNAWDVDFLPLIHKAFPSTPMVFLVREPRAILASHQRQSGIHMVQGNPVANHIGVAPETSFPDYQASVLIWLMESMVTHKSKMPQEQVITLDYNGIDLNTIIEVANFFGCQLDQAQEERVSRMIKRDSKATHTLYSKNTYHNTDNQMAKNGEVRKALNKKMQALYQTCISSHMTQTLNKGVM